MRSVELQTNLRLIVDCSPGPVVAAAAGVRHVGVTITRNRSIETSVETLRLPTILVSFSFSAENDLNFRFRFGFGPNMIFYFRRIFVFGRKRISHLRSVSKYKLFNGETNSIMQIYTASHKQVFIAKASISFLHSRSWLKIYHLTLNLLPHYFAKFEYLAKLL